MKSSIFILALIFLFGTPKLFAQDTDDEYPVLDNTFTEENLSTLIVTCYVCHNPRIKSHENIIAPPLVAVKYLYNMRFPSKESFTNKMTEFVLNPNNEKSIMQGAVMKFGVMPDMPLDAMQVRRIVEYIYSNEIEEPVWFPAYFEERHAIKWQGQ